ncbi:MAG TPA: HAD family phosphatase [Terriglobia bacterium]|nr:HAD family phosphatase [Terriglobia bacterium]
MLRALIFDFDGVIVDSEPLIMALTQRMAKLEGWNLTAEEYYRDYLALDDRGIVEHLYKTHEQSVDTRRRNELTRWKEEAYREAIRDGLPPVPGAPEFVRQCAARYPLAIASGSLRSEVEHLLARLNLRDAFVALSTADDCEHSKPHPCSYLTALRGLQTLEVFSKGNLRASECLALEDAPAGVDAAHAAGMRCLAITHSRSAAELQSADWVLEGFDQIRLDQIAAAFL